MIFKWKAYLFTIDTNQTEEGKRILSWSVTDLTIFRILTKPGGGLVSIETAPWGIPILKDILSKKN